MENFDIIWKGQKVGRIENCIPDMWYLEGAWTSHHTPISNDFEKLNPYTPDSTCNIPT